MIARGWAYYDWLVGRIETRMKLIKISCAASVWLFFLTFIVSSPVGHSFVGYDFYLADKQTDRDSDEIVSPPTASYKP